MGFLSCKEKIDDLISYLKERNIDVLFCEWVFGNNFECLLQTSVGDIKVRFEEDFTSGRVIVYFFDFVFFSIEAFKRFIGLNYEKTSET